MTPVGDSENAIAVPFVKGKVFEAGREVFEAGKCLKAEGKCQKQEEVRAGRLATCECSARIECPNGRSDNNQTGFREHENIAS